jgi:protein SCO1/2
VQEKLSGSHTAFKMISISIDPEHDTPDKLLDYTHRYKTGKNWRFFTGDLSAITAIQKAFNAYRGNKMNHVPLTFIKPSINESWYRIEGFTGASGLLAEFNRLNTQH